MRLPEGRELVARAAGVVGDDRVGDVDRVQQVPDDAVGRERRLVLRSASASTAPATRLCICLISRDRAAPRGACPEPVLDLGRSARRASARRRRSGRARRGTSLLRSAGSSVAWMIVLPGRHRHAVVRGGEAAADAEDHVGASRKIVDRLRDRAPAGAERQRVVLRGRRSCPGGSSSPGASSSSASSRSSARPWRSGRPGRVDHRAARRPTSTRATSATPSGSGAERVTAAACSEGLRHVLLQSRRSGISTTTGRGRPFLTCVKARRMAAARRSGPPPARTTW